MRSSIRLPIAGLIVADTVAFLLLWRAVTAEPVLIPPPPHKTIPAIANTAPPPFKSVSRRADPTTARLFAPPSVTHANDAAPSETLVPLLEPALRLVGVILDETPDSERIALVEYGQPARIARLRTGVQPNPTGWHVDVISKDMIELSRGTERRVLKLD